MVYALLALYLFLGGFESAASPATLCKTHISPSLGSLTGFPLHMDGTEAFFFYLMRLRQENVLSEVQFKAWVERLREGRLENPLPLEPDLSLAQVLHRETLQEYLNASYLDLRLLLKWSELRIIESQQTGTERVVVSLDTSGEIYQQLEFIQVTPNKEFILGPWDAHAEVKLTRPFRIMSTPVTQRMWVEVMGDNPSKFGKSFESVKLNLGGREFVLRPDNPVENISWYSAAQFANALSLRDHLSPVYDFSKAILRDGTSAAKGTLDIVSGEVTIAAPQNDIYQTRGYRLPTEVEMEYLIQEAGKKQAGDYPRTETTADLKLISWFADNSDGHTQPVGLKVPLRTVYGDIYDLRGNVMVWANDQFKRELVGGENPQGPSDGFSRVTPGVGYNFQRHLVQSNERNSGGPQQRYPYVGLRLAQTPGDH